MQTPPLRGQIYKKLICVSAAFFVAFFIFPLASLAYTLVSSDIESNTVWTESASPYVVEIPVTVWYGATLTVQPGVVVKFKNDANISVQGIIKAIGTAEKPIYLTSFSNDTVLGDTNADGENTLPESENGWTISLGFSAEPVISTFSYVKMSYSLGIFSHGTEFVLNNSEIKNTSLFPALSVFGGEVSIEDSRLENGISHGLFVNHGTAFIERTTVKGFAQSGISTIQGSVYFNAGLLQSNTVGFRVEVQEEPPILVRVMQYLLEKIVPSAYANPVRIISGSSIIGNLVGVQNDSTTVLDARQNWWGNASGPLHELNPSGAGDSVSDGVLFTSWLSADPFTEPEFAECCSNVAFIPGFQASRLYVKENGVERKLWEPNENADAEDLFLDRSGASLNPSVYTKDVIDEAYGFNIYKKFIEFMDSLVSDEVIADWKKMPYDWRKSIPHVVSEPVELSNGQTYKIVDEVVALAENSDTGKVTLVAHSNGGLVAKEIVRELERRGKANLIDKLILVAVPQIGTPKAIAGLLHGDKQDVSFGLLLNKPTARQLGENMPGAYSLLPSEKYFEEVTDPVIVFDESIQNVPGFNTYGAAISNFDSLINFLTVGRIKPTLANIKDPNVLNSSLLAGAGVVHDDLDNWTAPENIEVIQIAGWGLDTIKGVEYSAEFVCANPNDPFCLVKKPVVDRKPLFTRDGDETVVVPSAILSDHEKKFYLNIKDHNRESFFLRRNRKHSDILEVQTLQNFIKNIMTENRALTLHVTDTKPVPEIEDQKLRVSVHSPVSLDVYDSFGNHTGIVPDTTTDLIRIEEEIPNSYYLEFGEGKYVGFDADEVHTVKLQGTGFGTFTLNTEFVQGDTVVGIQSFKDILVTPTLSGELVLSSTTPDVILKIDVDGDRADDFVLTPHSQFDPVLYLQIMRKTILSLDLKKNVENNVLKKIDKAIELIQKNKITKAGEKIKKYIKQIDKKKPKKISEGDKQVLVDMLNNLLDNLK